MTDTPWVVAFVILVANGAVVAVARMLRGPSESLGESKAGEHPGAFEGMDACGIFRP